MHALVLFRSHYGNTRQVAEAFERRLRQLGHETTVQDLRARLPDLAGVDCVLIGAPTRMAGVTGLAKAALRKLRAGGLGRKALAVFDTYGPVPKSPEEAAGAERWINPGAAGILRKRAAELGLNVHSQTLRCAVREYKGPLADGELDKAAAFAEAFAASAAGGATS
jgi:sulfite reductase alpha subunit-like flavoprotein